jgi:hypothetical protein
MLACAHHRILGGPLFLHAFFRSLKPMHPDVLLPSVPELGDAYRLSQARVTIGSCCSYPRCAQTTRCACYGLLWIRPTARATQIPGRTEASASKWAVTRGAPTTSVQLCPTLMTRLAQSRPVRLETLGTLETEKTAQHASTDDQTADRYLGT